jgi:hypothetical protein
MWLMGQATAMATDAVKIARPNADTCLMPNFSFTTDEQALIDDVRTSVGEAAVRLPANKAAVYVHEAHLMY